jgi:hypothetical protein
VAEASGSRLRLSSRGKSSICLLLSSGNEEHKKCSAVASGRSNLTRDQERRPKCRADEISAAFAVVTEEQQDSPSKRVACQAM